MSIRKAIIQVTVLYDSDISPAPGSIPLETVLDEMDVGNMVGQSSTLSDEPVPTEKVKEELLAVGNDGEFFSDSDEGEEH